MAHKKGQGSSRNGRDSNAQRRGVKKFGGGSCRPRQHSDSPVRNQMAPRQKRRNGSRLHTLVACRRHRFTLTEKVDGSTWKPVEETAAG